MGNAMGILSGSDALPKNEQLIADEMVMYHGKWESRSGPGVTQGSQTDVFRKSVPCCPVDFTGTFFSEQLDGIFTSEKIVLPMMGPYNSNHLFRDSQKETKIPIYSDENYTVMHPLGEPGLHLGLGHGSKVSHLMIVKHSRDGPITFNEMLPSTMEEVIDLKSRMAVMDKVLTGFKDDVLISECGPKVMERATKGWNGPLGDTATMTIRDYLTQVIVEMPEDIRSGRPGYILKNKDDIEISRNPDSVRALIDEVYESSVLIPFIAIQPPSENSQLLSHMHSFMVSSVPEGMTESYRCCETILAIKNKYITLDQSEEEDDGEVLTRQSTRVS
jgi:hypothetical protein